MTAQNWQKIKTIDEIWSEFEISYTQKCIQFFIQNFKHCNKALYIEQPNLTLNPAQCQQTMVNTRGFSHGTRTTLFTT